MVTTSFIYDNYSGDDEQEQIRHFIVDACEIWGTVWVLLGGDTTVVPARVVWAMDCEANIYPDENDIRADLYYSDLDGTWDENGNHIYGEVEDEVDLHPEVFVGRASVDSVTKAEAWVSKVLAYEQSPPMTDFSQRMLFLAQILWSDPHAHLEYGCRCQPLCRKPQK